MNSIELDTFKVRAPDQMVYGPITFSTLVQWVQESRVLPATWVHVQSANRWVQARQLEPLRECFSRQPTPVLADAKANPAELRQFPAFSGFAESELEQFASFGEFHESAAGELVIRKGDPCDAVYFILAGALRVRLLIGAQENTLCKISAGELFGEVGMFAQGTRTADVVAETTARLFRITTHAFEQIIQQCPALAAPVLFAIAGTMARRIADDNQRFQREVTSQFLWR